MFAELDLPDGLSTLTASSVVCWYVWHTATQTIPNLVRAFRDEMAAARAECGEARAALHAELSAERNQRNAEHALAVETLRELTRRLPEE